MNGRCPLTNSNKEALRALFELRTDLKERFAYFEKQYLAAQPDYYEQALLNCLVVRSGVVAVFEDLQRFILEQAPTRLAVSLADNGIGSSVGPTARITLDQFMSLINSLPNNIIYLDLSHNNLGQLSPENLARILTALPRHIRAINLGFNGFNDRGEQYLTGLRSQIPANVRRVYWEDVRTKQVDIQAEREQLDQALDMHLPVMRGNDPNHRANDVTDLIEAYLDNDLGHRMP